MHPDLEKLLVKIWNECVKMPPNNLTAQYIYDHYYALTAAPKQGKQNGVAKDFVGKLTNIKEKCEGKVRISTQESKKHPGVIHFYHFLPSDWNHNDSIRLVRWRVYLNPEGEDQVLEVLKYIVERYVHPDHAGQGQVSRPIKAKVALIPDQRPDTIVVYTVNDGTAGYIAKSIPTKYQFHDSIPPMTRKMRTGVSIGAEPPALNGESQSFGEVRCDIIARALREALRQRPPQTPTFASLTGKYLKAQGIDPEHPEGQTNQEDMVAVHQSQSSSSAHYRQH